MEQSHRIDKATRLIEYLTRLADLRRKSVKDIANYNQVLWLSDVPKLKGCFTRAWGSNKEYDDSIWLEVQSRREPALPKIPNLCQEWVDQESLYKKTDVPLLKETIVRQVKNENWTEDSDQPQFFSESVNLADHTNVVKKWEQYVEQKWMPWVEEHTEWESIQKVYSKLFTIYQEQLKLGEEYELVVGMGLLTWHMPDNQQLQRHLLVATVSLDFDSRLGKFTVRPNSDGANLRPELDMLENDQPPKAEESAKKRLITAEDNPWARNTTDGVLKELIHTIDSKGEYHDRLRTENSRTTEKPSVEYAPALILRKRSVRGLTEILRKLKANIGGGGDIPTEFEDLAEVQKPDIREDSTGERRSPLLFNGEVYFPKPSNKEQRQIIEKLNHAEGVLVQGPPGTGKTHTIANLICHLLATGKRILVTAKTPRALKVIEQQLPEQIRPLCVNLLGSGLEERKALENSIGAVLQKTQDWDSDKKAISRDRLERRLNALRSEKAEIESRLRAIRESETHSQVVADGTYRGTAAHIARSVKADSSELHWFKDKVSFEKKCPFDPKELFALLNGLRFLTDEKRTELQMSLPSSVPSEEDMHQLFANEATAIKRVKQTEANSNAEFLQRLRSLDKKRIVSIIQALSQLREQLQKLHALPHKWINEALSDLSAGYDSAWRELHTVTQTGLSEISDIINGVDDIELIILEDINPKVISKDAESLRDRMAAGKKLGWGPFRSREVRHLIYLTKKVLVDGRKCKNFEQVTAVANKLRVQLKLKHLWTFWEGKADSFDGPYRLQFRELEANCNALSEILSVSETIDHCRKVMPGQGNDPAITWNDKKVVNQFIQTAKSALAFLNHTKAKKAIQDIIRSLQNLTDEKKPHPIISDLVSSISNRSVNEFAKARRRLLKLKDVKYRLQKIEALAPVLTSDLVESYDDPHWDDRLQSIERAWNWARAKSWLNDYINKEDVISISQRISQIESDIEKTVAELASNKAWAFCFTNMSERHRRHMELWQQSMRKLGKGTGKYAPKHRRDARLHLNKCRDAVPAWVMPLHRVWDTVEPVAGMFDVVIVDESSQCGMEALPLFYLGKKILIVGDDKQIAPDAVGIRRNAVHRLMDDFLYDFNFKGSFDVEASLFHQGKLRYSTRQISLREHFRCMPEIIQFSNNLCYSGKPLIPLRQYGRECLKPLEKVYVKNGYREGRGNRIVNRPEAEIITDKIDELCKNPRYAEKSMGVIILQGEAQARLIEQNLLERLGAEEMERRSLISGNPYSFQGDERDIIFLSMVAAPNERIGPLTKQSDERRFNVGASRAKDQMWLFHSVTRGDLSQSCFRSKLLEFFEETPINKIEGIEYEQLEKQVFEANRAVVKAPNPFDSWFEVDLALELAREKYRIIPQFKVAGKLIDLVIDGGGARLAVECDGDAFHDAEHYEKDMERQKILERCGWAFFRIRECEFYANKDAVLSKLKRALKDRGILPIGEEFFSETLEPDVDTSQINDSEDGKTHTKQSCESDEQPNDTFPATATSNGPKDIHEAKRMKYKALRDVIIASLKSRPHQSCVKGSVVTFVLKYLEIRSRGKPREAFANKINQVLGKMAKVGIITIYTAKNERVKLESEPYLSIALAKDMAS